MRVTLDVFSGRPNPSWTLTSGECRQLVDRVAGQQLCEPHDRAECLGFRGLVVDSGEDDLARRAGLPQRFSISSDGSSGISTATATTATTATTAGGPPAAVRPARGPADVASAVRWFLETSKGAVADDLCHTVDEMVAPTARTASAPSAEALDLADGPALTAPACEPFLTPLRLGFWNRSTVRPYNNCYNYAANFASNTLAQPGRRSGRIYTSFDCDAVVRAAAADGCRPACDATLRTLALAIWPGFDFHWWRLHPNNVWAQKVGWSPATQRDNSGRIIGGGLTPESSHRAPYTVFCGYFYAPLDMWVL
ncbi:MAG: hypothetical protein GY711_32885 [bacterium]|nr:hypothetical protein [bacterium]